jgi:hypothetical protein
MTLRDYQVDISSRASGCLQEYGIAYLSMEVRTGKTLTAFETIRKFGARNVLFVTKKKAIKSVEGDYEHYKPYFYCTVINFESVSKCKGPFDFVVCDEAHSLGKIGKPAKRVKDIMKFTAGLPIIYLSGTPCPESFSQLYHQFYISSFSPFKEFKNFYKFAHRFVDIKKKKIYGNEINDYTHARIDEMEPFMKHLFFTQTQTDSGFTEQITEHVIYSELSEPQKMLIDRLVKDRVYEGKTGAVVLADTPAKAQSKVHQICSGSVKDEDGVGHIISYNKANTIKSHFEGQKIAIFYKFQAEFEILKKTFSNWTASPEEFQQNPDSTFLGQFQSAREGTRLDNADALVMYTIDFSYLSYAQTRGRIVSKERVRDAKLYWIFSEGGIETKIYAAVCKKKNYTSRMFKKDYGV